MTAQPKSEPAHAESSASLALADVDRLEEVVDREALTDVCRSFFELFGISIRVFSEQGALLADVHEEQAVCGYINTLTKGRQACARIVSAVKNVIPADGIATHPCFTGATYRIVPIDYQGRRIGRFVIGPYLPAEQRSVPQSLLVIDDKVDAKEAQQTLQSMPRVRVETAERIAAHLRGVLDLILFASHRAHLTSEMHVASIRENYRELAEKTARLQQAYNRLNELDKLKSNFLATVSHELRTPLTSIIGYSEMLTSGIAGDLNEEQVEFVDTIRGKGDHLLALITSLLDLSKLEQGNLNLHREPLEVAALVTDVAKTITPQAGKKRVTVHPQAEAGLPPIHVDPVRMRQVLFNLADNALKFTPEGGDVFVSAKATTISDGNDQGMGMVLMSTSNPAIEFAVRDTGIGMAPDELPKVFDAFYQIDGGSTREHGGAGLGLSIVKRLVDAHGGKVRIESEVGRGTAFFVTIPIKHESVDFAPEGT